MVTDFLEIMKCFSSVHNVLSLRELITDWRCPSVQFLDFLGCKKPEWNLWCLGKKQSRRKRRRRLCWPGKEEDIISHSEHTRTHLASSEDLTYSNLKRTEIIISFSTLPPSPSLSSPTGDWGAWQITPRSWFSSWGPATYPIPINRWGLNYKNSAECWRKKTEKDWRLESGEWRVQSSQSNSSNPETI